MIVTLHVDQIQHVDVKDIMEYVHVKLIVLPIVGATPFIIVIVMEGMYVSVIVI